MRKVLRVQDVNEFVEDFFGVPPGNVKKVVMEKGEAKISYWTDETRHRMITDKYTIQRRGE